VQLIQDMYDWSTLMRNSSALALEDAAEETSDQFLKIGLEQIVAGQSHDDVRDVLYKLGDIEDRENTEGANVWEAAGGYAPTVGILGAVLGLIHVMLRLDHPSELGGGIATAFVATIYGVGAANLVFFPLGNRLKAIAGGRTTYREIATEGLLQLSKGNANPIRLRERLENMLESRRRAGLDHNADAAGESPAEKEAA
jgi:chemotaxis protein MotA